jgi:hypothetical protein
MKIVEVQAEYHMAIVVEKDEDQRLWDAWRYQKPISIPECGPHLFIVKEYHFLENQDGITLRELLIREAEVQRSPIVLSLPIPAI